MVNGLRPPPVVISPNNPVSKVRLFEYSNFAITARGYVSCDCVGVPSVPHDVRGILGESLNGSRLPHKFSFPVNKQGA
jgi:hypothetical protein